jgi:quinol monooxygenase YgiN
MSQPILVTGTMDLDPANRDGFIAAASELMAATRAEAGCEHYCFAADLDDPGRFHISERWASQADVDTHMATPHMAAFMGKLGEFGVKGASLTKWEGAAGSPLM